jgi:hypothetical protein
MTEADRSAPIGLTLNPDGSIASTQVYDSGAFGLNGNSDGPGGAWVTHNTVNGAHFTPIFGALVLVEVSMTGHSSLAPSAEEDFEARVVRLSDNAFRTVQTTGIGFAAVNTQLVLPTVYTQFIAPDGDICQVQIRAVSANAHLNVVSFMSFRVIQLFT